MTLLVDANVLIDLWHVGGLSVLTRIAPGEVLDIVLEEECLDDHNPGIKQAVHKAGIREVSTYAEWLDTAMQLKNASLSICDALNLYYAKTFHRILLTNERPLREKCRQHRVSVHGTLWVIEQSYRQKLVSVRDLCEWLSILPAKGSRFPQSEILRMRQILGCDLEVAG